MDFYTLLGAAGSVAGILGTLGVVIKGLMRLGALETKTNTMWDFQMRRALSEVVNSGLGTMNKPITFSSESLAAIEPFREKLVMFYQTLPPKIRDQDAEAMLRIEAVFGDELVKHVCMPFNVSQGACLLLALAVAKESDDVNLELSI